MKMLSICIPIYNFDVNPLIRCLTNQIKDNDLKIEIILIDDASNPEYKEINKVICSSHTYVELEKNVGRSVIRNLFLKYSTTSKLLFLDCDSLIEREDFLQKYVDHIKSENYNVIFGGRIYPKICPSRKQALSWKYGVYRESKSVEERKKNPNKSFMTNNFVIRKEVLEKIKFDERLKNYGHEDTLFGIELLSNNIEIEHIDNPVLNGDIESNENYLNKTENGIRNLIFIQKNLGNSELFENNVKLIQSYNKIKKIVPILNPLFFLFRKIIYWFLKKGFINLYLFDFYKLAFYSKEMSNSHK